MTFKKLTDVHLDALREISNVGMGNAATALSQMVSDTVDLHVPAVTLADIVDVPELIGGAIATVGDMVFDGSLRTQLERLRSNLTKGS